MEPSGEKPDSTTLDYRPPAAAAWSAKEKDERSEWFLIAGFIATVGFGIMGIGVFGLIFWISPGPDRLIDIFVCTMAVLMGLLFLTVTTIGVVWLSRRKPAGLLPTTGDDHANPRH